MGSGKGLSFDCKPSEMNKSYKPCHCGDDCFALPTEALNEPCWGQVEAVDEVHAGDDWVWVHACQGHSDCYEGGKYKPEPIQTK